MDPQEINNRTKMTIPEQPHIGVEDTGQYVPSPQNEISEDLANAGYAGHTHAANETFLVHLKNIDNAIRDAYGTSIENPSKEGIQNPEYPPYEIPGTTIEGPSKESIRQVKNPPEHPSHKIPSTTTDIADNSYPANKPLVKNIASNVGMPFRSVYKGFSSLIKSLLFKHGSSASPVYNGRTTVGDVIELKKEEKGELPILSPVSNSEDYRPQEEMPVPNNVTRIDDFRQSEVKNAA